MKQVLIRRPGEPATVPDKDLLLIRRDQQAGNAPVKLPIKPLKKK